MPTTQLIFAAVLPIFLIIGTGFLVRRLGWLDKEADRSLMSVVVNLLYPCLIFSFILGNDALRQPSNVLLPPLIGLTTVVGGFAAAMLVARKLNIGDTKECRTFAFTSGIYNYGYLPIPIVAVLFDRETAGVLLVHNLGVEVAMWSLGVGFILSANDPKSIWRRIFSGPVIAILVATTMNLLQLDRHVPNAVFNTIQMLGQCAIPIGIMLTGATFADLAPGIRVLDRVQVPLAGCLLRIGLFPACFLFFAWLFPIPTELKAVMCVQAAMPCGLFPIVLARHFDGAPDVALRVVLSTTLLSFLTIPLWISFGMGILGL